MHRGIIDLQERQRFLIKDPHWGRIAVENQPILFFALAQVLFGALAVRDVPHIDDHRGNVRILRSVLPYGFEILPGAVPMAKTKIKGDWFMRIF